MNTWLTLYNRLKEVDLEFEAAEALNDSAEAYKRLNAEQMYTGKKSDGADITPSYASSTIREKKRKGQPYDRVTLRDTGAFQQKLIVYADNENIYIDSDVPYSKYLAQKYTEKIFGLGKENRKEFSFGPYWSVLKARLQRVTDLTFK